MMHLQGGLQTFLQEQNDNEGIDDDRGGTDEKRGMNDDVPERCHPHSAGLGIIGSFRSIFPHTNAL